MGVLFIKNIYSHLPYGGPFQHKHLQLLTRWGSFQQQSFEEKFTDEKFTNEVCNVYIAGGGSDEVPTLEIS